MRRTPEDPLPADLAPVAAWLREHRPEPDESERARMRRRVAAAGSRPRHEARRPARARLAVGAMLAAGVVMGSTGAALAVSGLSDVHSASVAQYGSGQHGGTGPGSIGVLSPSGLSPHGLQGNGNQGGASQQPLQPARQLAAGGGNGQLPFTGYAVFPLVLGGIALLIGGLLLRRRTRRFGG